MHHPTDRITHTAAFVTPFVEHWLEREIAQWVCGAIFGSCTFVYIWNRTPFPVCVCVDLLFVCMHKMIMHPIYLYIYLFVCLFICCCCFFGVFLIYLMIRCPILISNIGTGHACVSQWFTNENRTRIHRASEVPTTELRCAHVQSMRSGLWMICSSGVL